MQNLSSKPTSCRRIGSIKRSICQSVFGKYFSASDGIHGTGLWVSDGSPNGTFMLKAFMDAENIRSILVRYGITGTGRVMFMIQERQNQWWSTDGTSEGTIPLTTTEFPGGGSTIVASRNYERFVCFGRVETSSGRESVWATDGTVQGTSMLLQDASFHYYRTFKSRNGEEKAVLFMHGGDIYVTDGTSEGTKLAISNFTETGPMFIPPYYKSRILIQNSPGNRLFALDLETSNLELLYQSEDLFVLPFSWFIWCTRSMSCSPFRDNRHEKLESPEILLLHGTEIDDKMYQLRLLKSDWTDGGTREFAAPFEAGLPISAYWLNNELYALVTAESMQSVSFWLIDLRREAVDLLSSIDIGGDDDSKFWPLTIPLDDRSVIMFSLRDGAVDIGRVDLDSDRDMSWQSGSRGTQVIASFGLRLIVSFF